MTLQDPLLLLVAFALGAVLSWLLTTMLLAGRSQRQLLRSAERLSAAEATAAAERERRQELERELERAEEALRGLDREVAVARERTEGVQKLLEEQRQFVERSRKEMEDAFGALAANALKGTSEQFLALAEQKLATSRSQAVADLDERRKGIQALLEPLRETLGKLDQRTGEIERARVDAYSRIDEQIRRLAETTATLQDRTTRLATALQSSQVRGRWGEIALRNVVEVAGMTAHCDFEEQASLTDGGRPDMTVRLPGGRFIAVDAKAPLTAYMEATEATEEADRQRSLEAHTRALRTHVRQLAARDYAEALGGGVDLVVLFLPGEPFLSAAFATDPQLQVDAFRSKVLLATPTTLIALLRTVAIYWQQRSLAENAEAIADTARELYERAATFSEQLSGVGRGLSTALDAYNRAVGSFERRLLPMAGRLEELKVAEHTRRHLDSPDPAEGAPRKVTGE